MMAIKLIGCGISSIGIEFEKGDRLAWRFANCNEVTGTVKETWRCAKKNDFCPSCKIMIYLEIIANGSEFIMCLHEGLSSLKKIGSKENEIVNKAMVV